MSRVGLAAVVAYVLPAAYILIQASRETSGGWINLKSLVPALVTFPVAFPLEWLGLLPDLTKPPVQVSMVMACSLLIYFTASTVAGWYRTTSY